MSAVMLLTALDTRGEEAFYLKGRLEALGCKVILVDMAMRAHSREGPTIRAWRWPARAAPIL